MNRRPTLSLVPGAPRLLGAPVNARRRNNESNGTCARASGPAFSHDAAFHFMEGAPRIENLITFNVYCAPDTVNALALCIA